MWMNIDSKQWTMNENWRLIWFSTSSWKCEMVGLKLWTSCDFNENSENNQHVVIICFHQEQTSFKRMEETVSLMGLRLSQNINCCKSRMKGKFRRVLLFRSIRSFGRDDGWFNCWRLWLTEMISELFVNNGIDLGNGLFSDVVFVTQWCWWEVFEDIGISEFVWVGCCVCTGAGDCPSERRATHL